MRLPVVQTVYFLFGDGFGLVTPGIAHKSQDLRCVMVAKFKHKRGHAKGLFVGRYARHQVVRSDRLAAGVACCDQRTATFNGSLWNTAGRGIGVGHCKPGVML